MMIGLQAYVENVKGVMQPPWRSADHQRYFVDLWRGLTNLHQALQNCRPLRWLQTSLENLHMPAEF